MQNRIIKEQIVQNLNNKKIIVLYGARQVGKTTLVREIMQRYWSSAKYINCDEMENRLWLNSQNFQKLSDFVWNYDLVVLDEAHRVENIRLNLKILFEWNPNIQIIATGSSSFDLANQINEPLTWRKMTFMLFHLFVLEIIWNREKTIPSNVLEKMLIYGSYPEVYNLPNDQWSSKLKEIANDYLYKDIFLIEKIKKPDTIVHLLRLLAFQIGNEVSYQEIANKLWVHVYTVQNYINLLEQSFVIFRLSAFSTNLRNEIKKKDKIYFWDLGIRNTIISNLNPLDIRNDVGALWENFCICEKLKQNTYQNSNINSFFWRNYQQQEIDYIEEKDGKLSLYEFKRNPTKKAKLPNSFTEYISTSIYKNFDFQTISKENFYSFLISK